MELHALDLCRRECALTMMHLRDGPGVFSPKAHHKPFIIRMQHKKRR